MPLETIYQGIQDDLLKVEDGLSQVCKTDFTWLSEVLSFALKAGGKRIRPALVMLSGKFYDYDMKRLLPMALSVELMHTATLVHDDAIDKSFVRRSRPTINKLWGEEKAVLLGDYLFAKAGEAVTETKTLRVVMLFSQTLEIISAGELNQALNSFNIDQTYDDYLQRIRGKTASLFALSTQSGAILSHASPKVVQAFKRYGDDLGIAFQIIDDLLDFIGTEEELGKPVGSDLVQGTLTLPAMMIMKLYPRDNPIKTVFGGKLTKEEKQENVRKAVEIVRNSKIVEMCFDAATDYCKQACADIALLPDTPTHRALVELTEYVIKRRK